MERLHFKDLGMNGKVLKWILKMFSTLRWTILTLVIQSKKRFLGLHDNDGEAALRCLKLQT